MTIENIPIGNKHKKSRKELMLELEIDEDTFKKDLAKIKEKNIVLFDEGYYRPTEIKEYDSLINKLKNIEGNPKKSIKLALKEREEL